jgi:pentatricopeptide repeat protein
MSYHNGQQLESSRQSWRLRAVALGQPSEDTTSSSSTTTTTRTILSIGSNGKDWMQWEQDLIYLGRQGRTDEALELFDQLIKSVMAALTVSSSSSPQTSKQPSPHVQLPPLSTRVRWWNAALDACARARPTRCDDAMALFQRGLQLSLPSSLDTDDDDNVRLVQPNVFTFGILTSACARARRADVALDLLRQMEVRKGRERERENRSLDECCCCVCAFLTLNVPSLSFVSNERTTCV